MDAPTPLPDQTRDLNRLGDALGKQTPAGAYAFVTVEFPLADTDVAIQHNLNIMPPNQVGYQVVQVSGVGHVYHDMSANRRAWTYGTIYLRSDVAGFKAVLLVFRPAIPIDPFIDGGTGWSSGLVPPTLVVYLGGSRFHAVQAT